MSDDLKAELEKLEKEIDRKVSETSHELETTKQVIEAKDKEIAERDQKIAELKKENTATKFGEVEDDLSNDIKQSQTLNEALEHFRESSKDIAELIHIEHEKYIAYINNTFDRLRQKFPSEEPITLLIQLWEIEKTNKLPRLAMIGTTRTLNKLVKEKLFKLPIYIIMVLGRIQDEVMAKVFLDELYELSLSGVYFSEVDQELYTETIKTFRDAWRFTYLELESGGIFSESTRLMLHSWQYIIERYHDKYKKFHKHESDYYQNLIEFYSWLIDLSQINWMRHHIELDQRILSLSLFPVNDPATEHDNAVSQPTKSPEYWPLFFDDCKQALREIIKDSYPNADGRIETEKLYLTANGEIISVLNAASFLLEWGVIRLIQRSWVAQKSLLFNQVDKQFLSELWRGAKWGLKEERLRTTFKAILAEIPIEHHAEVNQWFDSIWTRDNNNLTIDIQPDHIFSTAKFKVTMMPTIVPDGAPFIWRHLKIRNVGYSFANDVRVECHIESKSEINSLTSKDFRVLHRIGYGPFSFEEPQPVQSTQYKSNAFFLLLHKDEKNDKLIQLLSNHELHLFFRTDFPNIFAKEAKLICKFYFGDQSSSERVQSVPVNLLEFISRPETKLSIDPIIEWYIDLLTGSFPEQPQFVKGDAGYSLSKVRSEMLQRLRRWIQETENRLIISQSDGFKHLIFDIDSNDSSKHWFSVNDSWFSDISSLPEKVVDFFGATNGERKLLERLDCLSQKPVPYRKISVIQLRKELEKFYLSSSYRGKIWGPFQFRKDLRTLVERLVLEDLGEFVYIRVPLLIMILKQINKQIDDPCN